MKTLNLYTTLGCHLCEQAEEIIRQVIGSDASIELCSVEIADSEALVAAYGLTIPVVRFCDSNIELGWPFDIQKFNEFLRMNQ